MPYAQGKLGLTPELHATLRERLWLMGVSFKGWVNLMAERYLQETNGVEPPPGIKPDRRTLGGWGRPRAKAVADTGLYAVAPTEPAPAMVTMSGGEPDTSEMSTEQILDLGKF